MSRARKIRSRLTRPHYLVTGGLHNQSSGFLRFSHSFLSPWSKVYSNLWSIFCVRSQGHKASQEELKKLSLGFKYTEQFFEVQMHIFWHIESCEPKHLFKDKRQGEFKSQVLTTTYYSEVSKDLGLRKRNEVHFNCDPRASLFKTESCLYPHCLFSLPPSILSNSLKYILLTWHFKSTLAAII